MESEVDLKVRMTRKLNSLRVHKQRMKRLLFYAKGDEKRERLLKARLVEVQQSIGRIEK
ncbi:MAG: hypothetical protein ACQEP3_01770 [Patescibacteria group bacterium]